MAQFRATILETVLNECLVRVKDAHTKSVLLSLQQSLHAGLISKKQRKMLLAIYNQLKGVSHGRIS